MAAPTSPAIDAYIERFPPEVRERLAEVRAAIRAAAPEAVEKIGYGVPTYTLAGNLVHFGGFKRHIGFYPGPGGIEAFRGELGRFETSKGAIRFPLDRPLPIDLIRRIVEFRVEQSEATRGESLEGA